LVLRGGGPLKVAISNGYEILHVSFVIEFSSHDSLFTDYVNFFNEIKKLSTGARRNLAV
jgi:hypothetical protein